jgi:predicted protein tyrosine phosphatase
MKMKTKNEEIFALSCPYGNESQGIASRYLFVCSAGLLRSATASKVAIGLGYNARSCGTENYALIPLSVNLISWAQKIFFVNGENYTSALRTFRKDAESLIIIERKAVIWNIPDYYNYNDSVLVDMITKHLE